MSPRQNRAPLGETARPGARATGAQLGEAVEHCGTKSHRAQAQLVRIELRTPIISPQGDVLMPVVLTTTTGFAPEAEHLNSAGRRVPANRLNEWRPAPAREAIDFLMQLISTLFAQLIAAHKKATS